MTALTFGLFSAPTKRPRQKAVNGRIQATTLWPRQRHRSQAIMVDPTQMPPIQSALRPFCPDPGHLGRNCRCYATPKHIEYGDAA